MCRAMPTANTRAFNAYSPGRRICNVSNRTEDGSPRPEFLSLIPQGVSEGPKLYPIVGRHLYPIVGRHFGTSATCQVTRWPV